MEQAKLYAKAVGKGYLYASPLMMEAVFFFVIGYNMGVFGITTGIMALSLCSATPWIAIGLAELVIRKRREKYKGMISDE